MSQYEYEELFINLETDCPEKIAEIIQKIIVIAYDYKDDKENYSHICQQLGNLILFLVKNDRLSFGIKEKIEKNTNENMH